MKLAQLKIIIFVVVVVVIIIIIIIMQLPTLSVCFLLMTSKFTEPLVLVRTAIYWCIANCMKLNISKTKVISFSRKTYVLIYDYKLDRKSVV
jgi:hypothetical protein